MYAKKESESFRKTWDREEYAAKGEAREAREKQERKDRYEAKLAGKKYISKDALRDATKETESRAERLNVAANVGKMTLVPAGASVGKRGRGAGFYCSDCDLTFKDNLQLVEHLNSKQHLTAIGETGEVRRATVEEVRERLAYLKRKRDEEAKEANLVDLKERLQTREQEEERRKEERRRKRREKRRKTEGGVGHQTEETNDTGIIR